MIFQIPLPENPKCWFCNNEVTLNWITPTRGKHSCFCDKHQGFAVKYQVTMLHPWWNGRVQEAHLSSIIISRHNIKLLVNLTEHINVLNNPTPNPDYCKCVLVVTGVDKKYLGLSLPDFWPMDKSDEEIIKKMDQIKGLMAFL